MKVFDTIKSTKSLRVFWLKELLVLEKKRNGRIKIQTSTFANIFTKPDIETKKKLGDIGCLYLLPHL